MAMAMAMAMVMAMAVAVAVEVEVAVAVAVAVDRTVTKWRSGSLLPYCCFVCLLLLVEIYLLFIGCAGR